MRKLMRLLTGLVIYIIAMGSVFAAGDGVAPIIKPDQTDITFIPYPTEAPIQVAKGNEESIWLRPVKAEDVVYYRVLSVAGADQTSPIGTTDIEVETHMMGFDHAPIHVSEDMLNEDGQFVVKAAALKANGSWSENVIAAYNMVFGDYESASELTFVSGDPTEFMVGESYEMQLELNAPADSVALHGNKNVNLIINWEGGINFANVEYKFAAADAWQSVNPEDLTDLIRIPNTFKNFSEKGVWVKLTMARKVLSDEMWVSMNIAQGYSFLDATALSSVIDRRVPCVDRPAAMPAFNPEAGYIAKGSSVSMTSVPSDASIYYTTDGTEPSETNGTLYTAPVAINSLTTFKAIAITADGGTSFVSEAAYSVVGIPQITPKPAPYTSFAAYDSLVEITLDPATEGASIYYTTDGTEPTATNGTLYEGRFPLRANVLKAVSVKDADYSPVVTVEYRLRPAPPTATPAPVREKNKTVPVPFGTKVKLECAMEGAKIYWRIGGNSAVTVKDNLYTEEIELKEASTILKAMAIYNDAASQQVSFTYVVSLDAPRFSMPSGVVPERARVVITSRSVESNTNPNKQINIAYTTDGTEPTKENVQSLPRYTEPIEITETVTIKAMTWTVGTQGLDVSEMSSATYTVEKVPVVETVDAPTFSVVEGEVEKGTKVQISCKTEGAVIYYTVDGSEPTAESTEYKEAIEINEAVTIKAIAIKGEAKSKVAEAAYTVKVETPVVETVDAPTFSVAAGEVVKGTKVTLACVTKDAVIYYTVDGNEPTAESTEYKEAIEINEAVTIKAIAIKGEAKSKVAEAAYTVKPEGPSANEGEELAGVSVYPNPSDGLFNIELPVAATVEVFMSNGMLYQRVNARAGVTTLNIDRSGIYFLRIAGEGRTAIKRVIVR